MGVRRSLRTALRSNPDLIATVLVYYTMHRMFMSNHILKKTMTLTHDSKLNGHSMGKTSDRCAHDQLNVYLQQRSLLSEQRSAY